MNLHYEASNLDELENTRKDEVVPSYAGILVHDLPQSILDTPHVCGIDTETTGLDPRVNKPVLFQYYSSEFGPYLIRLGDELPENVAKLLASASHVKVVHHALFDMGMLFSRYPHVTIDGKREELEFSSIACTKVAAKLLDPTRSFGPQKLTALVDRYLGIRLDKNEQLSDWTVAELTESQITYAIRDVQYLPVLYERMLAEVNSNNLAEKYSAANKYLFLQMMINLKTDPRVYTY